MEKMDEKIEFVICETTGEPLLEVKGSIVVALEDCTVSINGNVITAKKGHVINVTKLG